MEVRTLEETDFNIILACFNEAFSDYYIYTKASYDFLWNRWCAANVKYTLSFGAFYDGKLVGFIISGLGTWKGKKTVYNAGTGVIPEYRGRRIAGQIYEVALPIFKRQGIKQSVLEVITENRKAIKIYQNLGFNIYCELACLDGIWLYSSKKQSRQIRVETNPTWTKEEFSDLVLTIPAWESSYEALSISTESNLAYKVYYKNELLGMAIVNNDHTYLSQLLLKDLDDLDLVDILFSNLAKPVFPIRVYNVDNKYNNLVRHLIHRGLGLTLKQYGMVLDI